MAYMVMAQAAPTLEDGDSSADDTLMGSTLSERLHPRFGFGVDEQNVGNAGQLWNNLAPARTDRPTRLGSGAGPFVRATRPLFPGTPLRVAIPLYLAISRGLAPTANGRRSSKGFCTFVPRQLDRTAQLDGFGLSRSKSSWQM